MDEITLTIPLYLKIMGLIIGDSKYIIELPPMVNYVIIYAESRDMDLLKSLLAEIESGE